MRRIAGRNEYIGTICRKYLQWMVLLITFWSSGLLKAQVPIPANQKKADADTSVFRLSETVINENRLQSRLSHLNKNIQIIDQQTIRSLPAHSVSAVLNFAAGVQVQQRGPFGSQADISIDGGSFEQTLVLLNGVKIVDAQTGHNTMNLPVPLDAIERIEIYHGPAARIYGVNSLTGAINIVTKKVVKSGISAQVSAGSSFKKNGNSLFNGRTIQLGGTLSGSQINQSLYGSIESGNGYRYNTGFNNGKIFYQASMQAHQHGEFSLTGGYTRNNFGANGFYAAPGDRESREVVETGLASLGYTVKLPNQFTLSPRLSYRYNYDDYRYFGNDLSKARSQHYSHSVNLEMNASYQLSAGTIGMGLEARREQIESSNIGKHNRNNFGGYAEFKTDVVENFLINVGTYVNINSDYGVQVFPGIDVGYSIGSYWKIVAQTGSGQRIPSFTDLYLNQRPGNIGNPNVEAERSWQTEGGIKFNRDGVSAQMIYFHRKIYDFIDWVRATDKLPWQPENFNNRTYGISFAGKYELSDTRSTRWTAGISYNLLSPRVDGGKAGMMSKYAIESLRHQLTGTLLVARYGFSATIAARYNERISRKHYFLGDFHLAYNRKSWGIYGDMQNVFDVSYIEAAAIPMPGRWVTLGTRLEL